MTATAGLVGRILMAALEVTREMRSPDIRAVAERSGVDRSLSAQVIERYWSEGPSARVNLAIAALENGCEPAKVAKMLSWEEMERFTMDAGVRAGYEALGNIHFKEGGRRNQVDLLLWRGSICLVVDCKRWAKPLTGMTLLDLAARQEMRSKAMAEYLGRVAPGRLEVFFTPVLVTVYEPMSRQVRISYIVPVNTLVSFLNVFDRGYVSISHRARLSDRWPEALRRRR